MTDVDKQIQYELEYGKQYEYEDKSNIIKDDAFDQYIDSLRNNPQNN